MLKRLLSLTIILFALSACNKPDPAPELKDPIYSDLTASLAATTQALEAEKKALEEHQKALKEVVPQTGQIKYAQKRVNESQERITKLEQEKQYLELKVEARKSVSRKTYLAAFKKGEPWPDPKEFESYQAEKRLRNAKKTWDVKERIKEAGLGPDLPAPAPAEGGGHH